MPLILGTNSIKDTGYNVANSLRFDRASGDYLSRTPSGAGNRKIFTFSTWLKGHNADAKGSGYFFQADISGSSNVDAIGVTASGFQVSVNSATSGALNTTQLFRDYSAWYHFVFAVDTTQSTASNRMKLYVNGSQITDFDTETYPSQDYQFTGFNTTQQHNVSWRDSEVDGYMCEVVFIDGQQLDPTSFGEFDEDSGIWKPKAVSGLTFGTNGFYLDFENSGSLGADVSGNGNNFTVNNLTSVDQSTDTCTNNFATMNVLTNPAQVSNGNTFSEGNCKLVFSTGAGVFPSVLGSIGMTSGKWYWEAKITSSGSSTGVGIYEENQSLTDDYGGTPSNYNDSDLIQFVSSGGSNFQINLLENAGATNAVVSSLSSGTIIGVAFDVDNRKLFFYTNGSEPSGQNIGAGTSLFDQLSAGKTWLPAFYHGDGGSGTKTGTIECNFGNPPFSISSGNTDGNGYGNFEYAVPSGYYALNTKNLAKYG